MLIRKEHTEFPVLDGGPFEALDVETDERQHREQDNGLDAVFLPVVVFGFGGPVQECHNILGHLGRRGRGSCARNPVKISAVTIQDNLPSSYSTKPSNKTRAMPMAPPGKKGL